MGKQTDVGSSVIVELWYRMILFQKIIPEKKQCKQLIMYISICVFVCVLMYMCVHLVACMCLPVYVCVHPTLMLWHLKKLFPSQ